MAFSIFSTSLRRVAILHKPTSFARLFSISSKLFAATSQKSSTLFIGGLNYDTTESTLADAFSKFASVKDARIITNRATNASKGFGYIEFESAEAAEQALDGFAEGEIDGFRPRVDFAAPRTETRTLRARSEPTNTVYLGNIPYTFTSEDLRLVFEKEIGELPESFQNIRLPAGRLENEEVREQYPEGAVNMGFGYIAFDTVEDAQKFVDAFIEKVSSGWRFAGDRTPKVDFAKAREPVSDSRSRGRGFNSSYGGDRGSRGGYGGRSFKPRNDYGDRFAGSRYGRSRGNDQDY